MNVILLQYSSVDTSFVSNYITHPFWNWVVEVRPRVYVYCIESIVCVQLIDSD